jgi:hypothetical protein
MGHMNLLRKFHFRLCGLLLLLLLQLGFAQEVSFRITPLRPVDELRTGALKAQPPLDHGTFLKPDLVELVRLDPMIKLDIRYGEHRLVTSRKRRSVVGCGRNCHLRQGVTRG